MTWWGWVLFASFILGGCYQLQRPYVPRQRRRNRYSIGVGRRVGPIWLGVWRRFR